MRRAHSLLLALVATLPLAGCYYDPGYVRSSSGGDAYYGTETTTVVQPGGGFYDPGYGYGFGPGYYGGYSDIAIGSVWYGGRGGYDRRYYRDRDGHDHPRPPPPGGWHGRPGDGDHRPPGGWQGGNRPPPPGGWQGGGRPPPPGGWHGGGRPPSPGGSRPSPSGSHPPSHGNFNRGGGNRDGH